MPFSHPPPDVPLCGFSGEDGPCRYKGILRETLSFLIMQTGLFYAANLSPIILPSVIAITLVFFGTSVFLVRYVTQLVTVHIILTLFSLNSVLIFGNVTSLANISEPDKFCQSSRN